MNNLQYWSVDSATRFVLVLSNVALLPGLLMFWFRAGHKGGAPRTRVHFIVERSFIRAWMVLTVIGFVLLEGSFQKPAGQALAVVGATTSLFGGVLLVAAEALSLTIGYEKLYPIINIFVVSAFLAQAMIGGAVLQSGLVAAWIGWVCIVWNIGWLVVLPLVSPRDIYYPVLHSITSLLVGIAMFIR